jgi:hypothetical protein
MQCACAELYCHLWPVCLYHTFSHYFMKGTIFEKKKPLLNINFVFRYCFTIFVWNTSHCNNSALYMVLSYVCICLNLSTRFYCYIFVKFELSRQIFEKSSNIKFHSNQYNGSTVVPCGQTDNDKLIIAFRKFANAPKMIILKQIRIQPDDPPLTTSVTCTTRWKPLVERTQSYIKQWSHTGCL